VIRVDSSVAVKWMLAEERSDRAYALYEEAIRENEPIVAPPLLPIEGTNVLYRRRRKLDGPTITQVAAALDQFLAFPIVLIGPPDLHLRALVLADTYGPPATYDAHCDLWTDDRRLLRALGGRVPFVQSLIEFEISSR